MERIFWELGRDSRREEKSESEEEKKKREREKERGNVMEQCRLK